VSPARGLLLLGAVLAAPACAAPDTVQPSDPRSPLTLRSVIELPAVKGRIDHLAIDLEHRRLYVAEYGNGSVDEIDLAVGRVSGHIAGLHEPQGVAYLPEQQEIVVACGDGTARFYAASDRHEVARIELGADADNIRIDPRNGHVIVGYGSGGLATIDPSTHRVVARLTLPGHPEGFRLIGSRAFVNVPDRGSIVSGDIDESRISSSWPTGLSRLNFPMAVTPSGTALAVAYRLPATLAIIDAASGRAVLTRSTCGDADDLFFAGDDILVVCGGGQVEVVRAGKPIRIETASGARTGLFVPELATLFVAVPNRGRPAAIWALTLKGRPQPK
jgi:DNA-binding beta-propeller fold protein YncE